MLDLVIQHGTLIDGSGQPRRRVDVGVRGDRIEAIGDLRDAVAGERIEAAGKIVAPGFIDVHNHSDGWLLKVPHLLAKTSQGFTTEVLMADGISYAPVNHQTAPEWMFYLRTLNALRMDEYRGWQSLADYGALLAGGNVQNFALTVPYANVRTLACGFGRHSPDDYQMTLIRSAIRQGLSEGAIGLSTGLDYIAQFFADTDELAEACAAMTEVQGLYITHVRYKKGVVAGVREAIEIGRRAGVPVHISHLKGTTPQDAEAVLALLDEVEARDVDLSFDVYPYIPGSTMVSYWLPYEVWEDGPLGVLSKLKRPDIRARFGEFLKTIQLDRAQLAWVAGKENARHQGRRIADYIAETGLPAADALCDLLIEERLAVLLVYPLDSDDALVEPFLAHPRFMLGSDGIYHPDGMVHPRVYGSAARVLGTSVRDKRLFTLESAVRKLSGFPAERLGLKQRGTVAVGSFADLVVFDAEQITDEATFANPHQYSRGVEHVLINGVPILRQGAAVEDLERPLPGRYLKRG